MCSPFFVSLEELFDRVVMVRATGFESSYNLTREEVNFEYPSLGFSLVLPKVSSLTREDAWLGLFHIELTVREHE